MAAAQNQSNHLQVVGTCSLLTAGLLPTAVSGTTANPENTRAYSNRGRVHHAKGEHDRAVADFTEVIRLDPGAVQAYEDRGRAYWVKGEHDKAIADFTKWKELRHEREP